MNANKLLKHLCTEVYKGVLHIGSYSGNGIYRSNGPAIPVNTSQK